MLPRISVFCACSLDGFIARPDGGLDWLDRARTGVPESEDYGFAAMLEACDALALGRITYEQVLGFGEWPYGDRRVYALTTRPALEGPGIAAGGPPAELAARFAADGVRRLYLDGGDAVARFLAADLVDDWTVSWIPVLLGEGHRLYGPTPGDLALRLDSVRHWPSGVVQTTHRRVRTAPH